MSTENRNPALCRLFVAQVKLALSSRPEITHTWSIDADEDHCILSIEGMGDSGYSITVEVWPDTISLSAEGFHSHYDAFEPIDDFLAEFLGILRDMLSPAMRIRERLAGGSPYQWHLENLVDGKWVTESTWGLFLWNWFGRRSERIYINTHLPPREDHLTC